MKIHRHQKRPFQLCCSVLALCHTTGSWLGGKGGAVCDDSDWDGSSWPFILIENMESYPDTWKATDRDASQTAVPEIAQMFLMVHFQAGRFLWKYLPTSYAAPVNDADHEAIIMNELRVHVASPRLW